MIFIPLLQNLFHSILFIKLPQKSCKYVFHCRHLFGTSSTIGSPVACPHPFGPPLAHIPAIQFHPWLPACMLHPICIFSWPHSVQNHCFWCLYTSKQWSIGPNPAFCAPNSCNEKLSSYNFFRYRITSFKTSPTIIPNSLKHFNKIS